MKKWEILMITSALSGLLAACHNNSKNGTSTDTTSATKDTTSITANDVNQKDTGFVFEAVRNGMAEVELGKLARTGAASNPVKNFGMVLEGSYSKAIDTLSSIARKKGILLPNAIDRKDQTTIDTLNKVSGKVFDKIYLSYVIDSHNDDIKLYDYGSKNCEDSALRAFATARVGALKDQVTVAQQLKSNLK